MPQDPLAAIAGSVPANSNSSFGNKVRMGISQDEYLKRLREVAPVLAAMGMKDPNVQDRFMGQLVAAENSGTFRSEPLIAAANNAGFALETTHNPYQAGNTPENIQYQETVAQAGDKGRALGMERRRLIDETDRQRREQTQPAAAYVPEQDGIMDMIRKLIAGSQ